jgi:hypothetical protein
MISQILGRKNPHLRFHLTNSNPPCPCRYPNTYASVDKRAANQVRHFFFGFTLRLLRITPCPHQMLAATRPR